MLLAVFVAQASSPPRLGWMMPQNVSGSLTLGSMGPQMAVDGSGHLHLIWMEGTLDEEDLCYVKSNDQGLSWSDAECIETASASRDGSFAVDITGTIHACWWDGTPPHPPYELFYAQRTSSGWTIDEPSVVVTNSWITEPSITVTGDDIHVVCSRRMPVAGGGYYPADLCYSRRPVSAGEWLTPTVIVDTAPASDHSAMTADQGGNLHVVWQENTLPNRIMYVSGTVGVSETAWYSPITVSTGLSVDATSPDILVGADDMVHTVFGVDVADAEDTHDIYYASFPLSNTEDISPTIIQGSRVLVHREWPTYAGPSLALHGTDEVHVVWNGVKGTDPVERIYYAVSEDHGASWSQPMAISPNDAWSDGFSTIATHGTLVHVAWQQEGLSSASDIYYAHSLPIITYYSLALKDYQ